MYGNLLHVIGVSFASCSDECLLLSRVFHLYSFLYLASFQSKKKGVLQGKEMNKRIETVPRAVRFGSYLTFGPLWFTLREKNTSSSKLKNLWFEYVVPQNESHTHGHSDAYGGLALEHVWLLHLPMEKTIKSLMNNDAY